MRNYLLPVVFMTFTHCAPLFRCRRGRFFAGSHRDQHSTSQRSHARLLHPSAFVMIKSRAES